MDHWCALWFPACHIRRHCFTVVLLSSCDPISSFERCHGRSHVALRQYSIWHNLFLLLCSSHGSPAHPCSSSPSSGYHPPSRFQLHCLADFRHNTPSYPHICRHSFSAIGACLPGSRNYALRGFIQFLRANVSSTCRISSC